MIRHILLDVDHTLYPRSSQVEAEMIRLINQFVSEYLHVSVEEAASIRKNRDMNQYTSTLELLQKKYGFHDELAFFKAIHPTNFTNFFKKDSILKNILSNLNVSCSLFTNSWATHAINITKYLEIYDYFKKIYDLPFCDYIGKPNVYAYKKVLSDLRLVPEEVLFIDDAPNNVTTFLKMGGKGILVDEYMTHTDFPAPVIKSIDNLADFKELFRS